MRKVFITLLTIMSVAVMAQKNQTYLTLNNGVQIPQFGLGVYSIPAGEVTYNSVLTALKAGYRHIDTAHAYRNERSVGQAIKDSGIPRDSIWVTSKLWPNEYGEEVTPKQLDKKGYALTESLRIFINHPKIRHEVTHKSSELTNFATN